MTPPIKRFRHTVVGLLIAAFVASMALVSTGHAQAAATTEASVSNDFPELRAKLKLNVPDLRVDEIHATPIPGLFAVVSGRSTVLYVDAQGEYVLNGHLFESKSRTDLTNDLLGNLARIDPKALPLSDSFAEVRGNGKRQLYVFSDPDCPYCKKLEQELPAVTDVTIHVFLFPLVGLHPNARIDAESVWCSNDPPRAWSDKMLKDILPAPANCANPLVRNLALGDRLGINATPTLIFSDGTVIAGAIPAERIEQLLIKTQ